MALPTLQKNETILIKPSKPTPSHLLSFSSIDNDPNLNILCQTIYAYKASINGDIDPASLIQQALSKVLVYYYPLAGKLKKNVTDGKLQINCSGEGVPFLLAKADCTLESLRYFEGIDVEIAKLFVHEVIGDEIDGKHPLVIQLTKFEDGGFTIGMGLSHSVCDGYGAAQFFKAMAEFASGKEECTVKPIWERERLIGKDIEPKLIKPPISEREYATSPYLPSKDLVHESFNLGDDCIRRLKMSLFERDEEGKENFTTLEVLSAYVWKARSKALELNLEGRTIFSLAMGIRHLLDPPIPDGYYGNAFISSQVVLEVRDLIESSLSRVARLIKEGKKNASRNEYIRSWLGVLESTNLHRPQAGANGASMVLTDWRQLGLLEQVDFGWKEAVNVIPVPWKIFGYVDLCIFLPACKVNPSTNDGVRVLVCLPRPAMKKFKEEMDDMKLKFTI